MAGIPPVSGLSGLTLPTTGPGPEADIRSVLVFAVLGEILLNVPQVKWLRFAARFAVY